MQTCCTVTSKACKCLLTSWRRTRPSRHAAGPPGLSGNYLHPGSPPGKWKGLRVRAKTIPTRSDTPSLWTLFICAMKSWSTWSFGPYREGVTSGIVRKVMTSWYERAILISFFHHICITTQPDLCMSRIFSFTCLHTSSVFSYLSCRLHFWRRGRGFDNLTSLITLSFLSHKFQDWWRELAGWLQGEYWL